MLTELMDAIYAMTKKSPADYTDLETTIGDRTLVYRSGGMATLVRYGGISKVASNAELTDMVGALQQTLNPFFLRRCHELQFVLDRDLMHADRLKKRMAPVYETANRLGVGEYMKDIFDEQAETMAKFTMDDSITLVLYTNPNALSEHEFKDWVAQLREMRRMGQIHIPPGTQDETFAVEPQLAIHEAYVNQVVSTLKSADIGGQAEVCDIWTASTIMARSIDPMGISDEWSAWLTPKFDDRLGLRVGSEPLLRKAPPSVVKARPKVRKVANTSVLFPPPIRDQLLTQEAHYPKSGFLEYAGRLYATLAMVVPPRRDVNASMLLYSLSGMKARAAGESERVPYRISMRMRAQGLNQLSLRASIAPIVAAGSNNNRKLMRAIAGLRDEAKEELAMASLSASITTWVDASIPNATEILKSRIVALRTAASQWGDVTLAEASIDRFDAFINSCPGVTQRPCSNEAVGNIREILPLLPWARPASPLGSRGTELYRSLDGAILPTASHSSEQDYWLETMTAPMGGGKSAQANRKHLEYIFAPGRTTWPFLHILDIGGSVSGLIQMIQDALPDDMKHLAFMHTLRNDRRNAINMCDTKLGLRHPLEGDLQATVDFISGLVTPAERGKPYDNMGEFIKTLLKSAYKRYSDEDGGSPKLYRPGIDAVDKAIVDLRLEDEVHPNHTSWFEVADRLGAKGNYPAATLAHRQAMPTLPDLDILAKDENIRGDYMTAIADQGVPVPITFCTQLALARESFPIFTATTELDLSGRRITALDLADVARVGSPGARKQASLMFQVAYELFTRNIRMEEDDLSVVPRQWLPYYRSLLDELKSTDKHVTLDEYHRTMIKELSAKDSADHDTTGLRATLIREGGRESRKWGLSLLTISQLSADHGQLHSLASCNHILKRGSAEETAYQQKHLNLSATDVEALRMFVNGPTKAGVTFLSQWTTKAGKYSQLFTSTMGPKTLWSLSSTFEDKTIRKIVFDAIGRDAGRAVLSRHYPGGSAASEVERRKLTAKKTSNEDIDESVCMEVAQELVTQYKTNPMNYK